MTRDATFWAAWITGGLTLIGAFIAAWVAYITILKPAIDQKNERTTQSLKSISQESIKGINMIRELETDLSDFRTRLNEFVEILKHCRTHVIKNLPIHIKYTKNGTVNLDDPNFLMK